MSRLSKSFWGHSRDEGVTSFAVVNCLFVDRLRSIGDCPGGVAGEEGTWPIEPHLRKSEDTVSVNHWPSFDRSFISVGGHEL